MQQIEPLKPGQFYHIYNHGVADRDLFREQDNYEYFLKLYDKYITPVAETFAWVLMKNHFHLLVRIKEEEVSNLIPDRVRNPVRDRVSNPVRDKPTNPSLQFSKLFNSYAQAFNKRFGLHGPLFERPFKRKRIESDHYLKEVILYIHNNPVHHGFCNHPVEYSWSSYLAIISVKPTNLKRNQVIGWFDCKANFVSMHDHKIEPGLIEKWLEI